MEKAKPGFSEGPWSIPHFCRHEVNCDCRFVLCDSRMGAICMITASYEGDDPPLEEAKANARLIAQSPEMYRAICDLLEAPTVGDCAEILDRMNAVIAAVEER